MLEFVGADPTDLTVDAVEVGDTIEWSVANGGDQPRAVDRVRLRWRVVSRGALRMFRNGYQSWSPSGGGVVTEHPDPSRAPDAFNLTRAMYHADPAMSGEGEVRSDLVTALAGGDDTGEDTGAGATVLGFDGGDRHDGTFRLSGDELVAEAYLGGAVLQPGERRQLHTIRVTATTDVGAELDRWATWAAAASAARAGAPFQVGWCSWYHYFDGITETTLRANLARAADWPFDVFQLDDGYQAAIGDWLETGRRSLPRSTSSPPTYATPA
jgi:alpha-galactosidase